MTVLLVAAAAMTLDAVSKRLASRLLVEGRLYAVTSGWGVRLVNNRRASLSVAHATALFTALVVAVLVADPHSLTAVGVGMAIGGAAGNLVDRIRRGAVVDFVAAGRWPVFNLADTAMTVGWAVAAMTVL